MRFIQWRFMDDCQRMIVRLPFSFLLLAMAERKLYRVLFGMSTKGSRQLRALGSRFMQQCSERMLVRTDFSVFFFKWERENCILFLFQGNDRNDCKHQELDLYSCAVQMVANLLFLSFIYNIREKEEIVSYFFWNIQKKIETVPGIRNENYIVIRTLCEWLLEAKIFVFLLFFFI